MRLLGTFRDNSGRRQLEFRRGVELMTQTNFDDFPRDGGRAFKEFMDAIAQGPGTITTYHGEWLRTSGVSENSSVAREHRILCESLRLGVVYDQFNLANSAMAEHITRRIIQREMAVARGNKHPDYVLGLGHRDGRRDLGERRGGDDEVPRLGRHGAEGPGDRVEAGQALARGEEHREEAEGRRGRRPRTRSR